MANEKLRIDITARDGASKTINNVNRSMGNMNKQTRRGTQALTQLARGLDDAQYGMLGLRNNLIEVGLSFGGLKGIAISAALVGLGYFIESLITTKDKAKEARDYVDGLTTSIDDLIAKYNSLNQSTTGSSIDHLIAQINDGFSQQTGTLSNINKLYGEWQDSLDKLSKSHDKDNKLAISSKKKQIELLKSVKKHTDDSAKIRLAQIDEEIKKQNQLVKSEDEEDRENAKKRLTELGKQRINVIKTQLSVTKQLAEARRDLNKLELGDAPSQKKKPKEPGVGYSHNFGQFKPTIVGENYRKAQAELSALFDSLLSEEDRFTKIWTTKLEQWKNDSLITVEQFKEGMDAVKKKVKELGEEVKQEGVAAASLVGPAIAAFANAIFEPLEKDETIGDRLLKSMGQFMVQFGGALVALGLAEDAWLKSFNSGEKIAAGTALIIAGAAISAAYSKKPGKNSRGIAPVNAATRKTPVLTNSDTAGGTVAVAKVKGQDLILALENANYSRRGYLPS